MRCFLYRILISHSLDSGRPAPDWVQRHISLCPACREIYETAAALSSGRQADMQGRDPFRSSFVTRRVMAAVEREKVPAYGIRGPFRKPLWGMAAASLLAVIMIGAVLFVNNMEKENQTPEEVVGTVAAMSIFSRNLLEYRLAPEEQAHLLATIAQPLTDEVRRLSEDVQVVKGALLAFFPIDLTQPESGEPDKGVR